MGWFLMAIDSYLVSLARYNIHVSRADFFKSCKHNSKLCHHWTQANNMGLQSIFGPQLAPLDTTKYSTHILRDPDNSTPLSFHFAFSTLSGSCVKEQLHTYIHT